MSFCHHQHPRVLVPANCFEWEHCIGLPVLGKNLVLSKQSARNSQVLSLRNFGKRGVIRLLTYI